MSIDLIEGLPFLLFLGPNHFLAPGSCYSPSCYLNLWTTEFQQKINEANPTKALIGPIPETIKWSRVYC